MRLGLVSSMAVAASFVLPLSAHHVLSAQFDMRQTVTLTGVIAGVEWINPHTWIHVDVRDTDGNTVTWSVETAAPNALRRRAGFDDSLLSVGTAVTVVVWPAKDSSRRASGKTLSLPDGRAIDIQDRWMASVGALAQPGRK